jgi:predicted metal-binding membrane protein
MLLVSIGVKDVCLGKCRSPLDFLLGSWRDGRWGVLRMGAKHDACCGELTVARARS